jgi:hypothetical protein
VIMRLTDHIRQLEQRIVDTQAELQRLRGVPRGVKG